eukprot:scaffold420_cov169-Ochromonas_danica.AAC.25
MELTSIKGHSTTFCSLRPQMNFVYYQLSRNETSQQFHDERGSKQYQDAASGASKRVGVAPDNSIAQNTPY